MTTPRTLSGIESLREATGDRGYDELGEAIQCGITHKEWQWLSDAEKARYIATTTEPEVFDDGS